MLLTGKEFKDLQISYLKASVIDIELLTDHAILALFYNSAKKFNVKYILHGGNVETEGNLPSSWVRAKFIEYQENHEKFGSIPIKTFLQYTHYLLGICISFGDYNLLIF